MLRDLDALEAKVEGLSMARDHAEACAEVCVAGIEALTFRREETTCKCRRLPSLGVHRLHGRAGVKRPDSVRTEGPGPARIASAGPSSRRSP